MLRATFEAVAAGALKGLRISRSAPEATTDGGARALQHVQIVLVDGTSVLVGCANASDRTATLQTFGRVQERARARFGHELKIEPRAYETFLLEATKVFEG